MVAAFQLPQPQTQERLAGVMQKVREMNPAVQAIVPNYERLNSINRKDAADGVEALEKALK